MQLAFDRLMLKLKTCPVRCIIKILLSGFCKISHSEFWETQSSPLQAPHCSLAQPTRSGVLSVILSVSHPLFFSLVGLIHVQNSNIAFFLLFIFYFQEIDVPFYDACCDFMCVDCCLFKPVLGFCVVMIWTDAFFSNKTLLVCKRRWASWYWSLFMVVWSCDFFFSFLCLFRGTNSETKLRL